MEQKQKIVVGITGASGAIYAYQLIQKLHQLPEYFSEVAVVFSDCGKQVWDYEVGEDKRKEIPFTVYENNNFFVPFASGSAGYNALVIAPCSMGTLGRIANGISNDLLSRTADVMLKEQQKLLLLCREMPLNAIHLENMKKLCLAGASIMPASPSFYSLPKTIEELVNTVVERILQQLGVHSTHFYSWNKGDKNGL